MPERGKKTSLEALPFSVIRKLTQYLDRQFPEHHNWMSFLEHAEIIGVRYSPGEVANFQSLAQRSVGSPSEAIFQDFITRSKTSDDVYIVLKDMGHAAGMNILKDHVSPHLLSDNSSPGPNNEGGSGHMIPPPLPRPLNSTTVTNGGDVPSLPMNGQYFYHPSHGPMPVNVPQTYMRTTVLRVNACAHLGHPPHCTCMGDHAYQQPHPSFNNGGYQGSGGGATNTAQACPNRPMSASSNSSFTSVYMGTTHSPGHNTEYYYGNQMTPPNQMTSPPTQFASPPPPPYSPGSAVNIPSTTGPPSQEPPTSTSSSHPLTNTRHQQIHEHSNGMLPSDSNGCGPLPTLPLSPDDVASVPNSRLQYPVLPDGGCGVYPKHTQSAFTAVVSTSTDLSTGGQSLSTGGQSLSTIYSSSSTTSGSSYSGRHYSSSDVTTNGEGGGSPLSSFSTDRLNSSSPSSLSSPSNSSSSSSNGSSGYIHVNNEYPGHGQFNSTYHATSGGSGSTSSPPFPSNGSTSSVASNGSSSPDILFSILNFKYSELCEATRGFTEGLIGHGAFGGVFRASIRGCGPYAIKKLHNKSEMESEMDGTVFYEPLHQESFMLELQSLVKYKNRNILSLVAISSDGPRPCLIYEYMENGSLADCLLGKRNINLSWRLRLDIAGQIADALNFLHTVNHPHCLVHGDVKSSNILLDRYNTPKLSDFGLAKECQSRPNNRTTVSRTSRVAMGTVAYMAPELLRNAKPSAKTDVWAFGVVMLELYTGKPADDPSRQTRALVYHLQPLFTDPDKNRELICHEADERAGWSADTGLGFFDIATFCLMDRPKHRSPMDQVRDQIFKLKDEAEAMLHYQFQNMTLTSGGAPNGPQNTRWN